MAEFPRTTVGGVSLSRMIIGINLFLGYSHISLAKDRFIKSLQTRKRIADIITEFLEHGVDTMMFLPLPILHEAVQDAQDRTGRKVILVATPNFNILSDGPEDMEPERMLDACREMNSIFCMTHQCVTDANVDRKYGIIRDIDKFTGMIRERGMIPGLSTHMPETVVIADKTGVDVETYIQIYNAAGFLMQVEVDWIMHIIRNAKKPVMTIKPLASGKLLPVVGLTFVWNTIREQDMVTIGVATPDEAREDIELSLDLLNRRIPDYDLQTTRSKKSLE